MVSLNSLTTEQGYATNQGSLSGWPVDPAEHVADLIYPLSIQVFDRMRRGDDQIKAILNAITLPIRQARWWIDPNGADPQIVQFIASDLNLPIKGQPDSPNQKRRKDTFSWKKHLREALLHLPYGHMPFEIVCDTNRGDGLAHLNRLSPRMPVTIGRIETDRSGQLRAVYQYPTILPGANGQIASAITPSLDKDTGMVKIAADRLVWYVNELEGAAWQGNSILRNCFGMWQLKNRALKVNAFKDERNGMGIPWVENAPGVQDLTPGKNLAESLRAGEAAGGSLPAGSKLHIDGVSGQLPDIIASINMYNEGMARVMLTQFLNLGTTKTGSRALGDSFIDFFKLALDAVTQDMADTGNADVVEQLVSWNYGEDVQCPLLVCDEVDLETDLPPDSLVALASAGLLTNDEGTESYLRQRYRLPSVTGPGRPVQKPESAFALPTLPVTARARDRRVKAKASSKTDALAEADRARTHVEAVHKGLLKPAWVSLVRHADMGPVVQQATGVMAAADTSQAPLYAPIIVQQLSALQGAAVGQRVDSIVHAGILAGHAQGDVQAQLFMNATREQGLTPLPPYDAQSAVAGWWNDALGATSRRVAQALSDALDEAETLDRADLLDVIEAELEDTIDAEFFLDDAMSWSLSQGAMDRYQSAGVQQVEFLTAEDSRVDEPCSDAEAGGPYSLGSAPVPPLHAMCRCAIAPVS